MKYTFLVEYDSDTEMFCLLKCSDNVETPHSGSSYLRIKPKDENFYGTIACHHDYECYDTGNLKCKGQHFNFFIEKKYD